jgi:hypothetical protein
MTASGTVEVDRGIRWEVMSHGINDDRPCILIPVTDAIWLSEERLARLVHNAIEAAQLVRAVFEASYVIDKAKGYKPSQIAKLFPDRTLTDLKKFSGQHDDIDKAIELLENAQTAVAKRKATRVEVAANYNELFIALGRRDGFHCRSCGDASADLQIDHIYPVSRGGGNEPENLQLLCKDCNMAKGARV